MLVQFKGEYSHETRAYGCSKCGTGRSINGKEVYKVSHRTYYEGRLYIFEKDVPVEVDTILGKYLLNRKYQDKEGNIVNSFEEVKVDTEEIPELQ